jgi:phage-related protein
MTPSHGLISDHDSNCFLALWSFRTPVISYSYRFVLRLGRLVKTWSLVKSSLGRIVKSSLGRIVKSSLGRIVKTWSLVKSSLGRIVKSSLGRIVKTWSLVKSSLGRIVKSVLTQRT